jgi:hypothetical protein
MDGPEAIYGLVARLSELARKLSELARKAHCELARRRGGIAGALGQAQKRLFIALSPTRSRVL